MTNCRDEFQLLLENTFVSSKGSKDQIYTEMMSFLQKVLSFIPDSLFRYRSLSHGSHTIKSFEEGTISLCTAKCFSDKYDSLVFVDEVKECADIKTALKAGIMNVMKSRKERSPLVRAEKAAQICYYLEQGLSEQEVAETIINEHYSDYLNKVGIELKQRESRYRDSHETARIACFTESVQSKFMWDTYAGGYSGFALEYDLKKLFINCINKGIAAYVFPVIYTDKRPDLTIDEANYYCISNAQKEGWVKYLNPLRPFLNYNLLYPHKPFLYKDKEEYGHEKEWRLLYYGMNNHEDHIGIPDEGCLKAIYYGMDIKKDDLEALHRIALKKGIKEYFVSIDNHSRKYSLEINPIIPE